MCYIENKFVYLVKKVLYKLVLKRLVLKHTSIFRIRYFLSQKNLMKMTILLLLLNLFIVLVSCTLLTILKKYLKEIPLDKQFIRHKILIDLADLTMAFVSTLSSSMILRHIFGPFHHVMIVEAIMLFLQSLYDLVLACIVSVQVTQVLTVFCS
jgi:hypothetical protein